MGGQIPAPDLGEGHGPCGGGSTAPKFGEFLIFDFFNFLINGFGSRFT